MQIRYLFSRPRPTLIFLISIHGWLQYSIKPIVFILHRVKREIRNQWSSRKMSWIMDFTTNFIFPHISRLCWLFGLLRILLSFCKMAMNFTTNFNFPDYFKVVLALWIVANTAKLNRSLVLIASSLSCYTVCSQPRNPRCHVGLRKLLTDTFFCYLDILLFNCPYLICA